MPTFTLYPSRKEIRLDGALSVMDVGTLAVEIAAGEAAVFAAGETYLLTIKRRGNLDGSPYVRSVLAVTGERTATAAVDLRLALLLADLGGHDALACQVSVDASSGGPLGFSASSGAIRIGNTARRDGDVQPEPDIPAASVAEVQALLGQYDLVPLATAEELAAGTVTDRRGVSPALLAGAIGGRVPAPATADEITTGTEESVRLMSPSQIRLAVETFASSGSGGLAVTEVSSATLQPAYGRQYIASNDLELAAPATPEGTLLWESRIYLREGATLSYPAGWRVSGFASGTGANLVVVSYLDGNWCLEWRAAFELASGTRLYVSATGDDGNDGYSWAAALRSPATALALAAAGAASEIWISEGTYNAGTLHGFEIPGGVTVYGGFQGLEQTLAERSHAAPEDGIGASTYTHETKLTNSRLVLATALQAVTGQQTYGTAIPTVSGCTIADSFVGALANTINTFQCVDCRIVGNQHVGSATYNGGGSISTRLQYCTVAGNTCGGGGAGVYQGTISNCLISANTANPVAASGGGALSATLYSCRLTGNSAYDGGGASTCTMYSCRSDGNTASHYGGGWYGGTAYNCESIRNAGTGEIYGGTNYWSMVFGSGTGVGIYTGTAGSCVVANCQYAGYNGTTNNCTALHLDTAQTYVFNAGFNRNHLAFGCGAMTWGGTQSNNMHGILADFAAPLDLPDGLVGAANEEALLAAIRAHGYDLAAGATAIGQGNNAYATEAYDYRGRTRIVGTVDCGAYEYQG